MKKRKLRIAVECFTRPCVPLACGVRYNRSRKKKDDLEKVARFADRRIGFGGYITQCSRALTRAGTFFPVVF